MTKADSRSKSLKKKRFVCRKEIFMRTYNKLFYIWLIPILFWVLLFSIYRSINPMQILIDLPPVDVISVLSNTLMYSGNSDENDLEMRTIISLMEDIYMRNEEEYLNNVKYSTIVVEPTLVFEDNLYLKLAEGFYNFDTASIEFNQRNLKTILIQKLKSDNHTPSIVTSVNNLFKLVFTPKFDGKSLFKFRKFCEVGSFGSSISEGIILICYFFNKLVLNSILQVMIISIFSISSIAGLFFSIFNIVMVSSILKGNKNSEMIIDILIYITAAVTNFYFIVVMISCLKSLIFIVENDIEDQNQKYTKGCIYSNETNQSIEFNFNNAGNMFCGKDSRLGARTLPVSGNKNSSKNTPKSANSNSKGCTTTNSSIKLKNSNTDLDVPGLNLLFGSSNSDEDSIISNTTKHPRSKLSRFSEVM